MDIEDDVAAHYDNPRLEEQILDGLRALGHDPERIDPEVLAAVDEFHIGGPEATRALADGAGLRSGMQVLDVGCGIGGPARYLAQHLDVRVHGVDLTPEFVRTAESLTRRCGLDERVQFSAASVIDLPFDDGVFDAAVMIHVGMNIADKGEAFSEVHRVLKPDAVFAIYDVLAMTAGTPKFPLPWAGTPTASFLENRDEYLNALTEAGFHLESERNRQGFALEYLERIQERMSDPEVPPLGMHLAMGQDAGTKIANLAAGVAQGMIAPVELISRRHD